MNQPGSATVVFVSYAREDADMRVRLGVALDPLARLGVTVWSDDRIEVSRPWSEEIERYLTRAAVAVLLVSADFLASDYIRDVELPRLVGQGVPLVCVPVSDSAWESALAIAAVQWPLPPEPSLRDMRRPQRERALKRVYLAVNDLIGRPQPAVGDGQSGVASARQPQRIAIFVTALELEADAVSASLIDHDWVVDRGGTQHRTGSWSGTNGHWQVIVVESGMGNEDAAAACAVVVETFSPEIAFFVGVAGGLKDVRIGDVVVASEVLGFEYGKDDLAFMPRGKMGEPSYLLTQMAMRVGTNQRWQARAGETARSSRAYVGPIASGRRVIASLNSPSAVLLRMTYSNALAVDMEGLDFLRGSRRVAVDAVVVRGISDLIDNKSQADASGSQIRAASHAAAFCFELLELVTPSQQLPTSGTLIQRAAPEPNTAVGRVGHEKPSHDQPTQQPRVLISADLGLYAKIDVPKRAVVECHMTRNPVDYSRYVQGKDPRDAHFITGRMGGLRGETNVICSVYTQNMLFGVRPPALGEYIINLGEAAQFMFDHNIFQENRIGVDFCEKVIEKTNPSVVDVANRTPSPHAAVHGYPNIGDIMRAFNPFSGEFSRESLAVSRWTREMFALMEGRHLHPSAMYPGGVATTASVQLFTDYYARLMRYVEFMKRAVPLHDDLFDFFYDAMPGYEQVGRRRIVTGCWGAFQDPDVCNYTYRDMTHWGRAMGVTPGIVVDGKLVTNDLGVINLGIRLHTPSPDEDGRQERQRSISRDPIGYPVDYFHPWNQQRESAKLEQAHKPVTSPRWFDGSGPLALETGPIARMWSTALSQLIDLSGYVVATGSSIQINLPKTALKDQVSFEWHCPKWSNTIERNRARTYFQAYAAGAALHYMDRALNELRQGRTKTWEPFNVPDDASGCGFTEDAGGALSHHMLIRGGKIFNYHVLSSTQWNASHRDGHGTPGPCEEAVQNTPIFEEGDLTNLDGIDLIRTVRSFDLSLPSFEAARGSPQVG